MKNFTWLALCVLLLGTCSKFHRNSVDATGDDKNCAHADAEEQTCKKDKNAESCGAGAQKTKVLTPEAAAAAESTPNGVKNDQPMDGASTATKDYYFTGYAHFSPHELMLKDEVRTLTYRDAIYLNRHLFRDKVVLDIGSGTGILSMFAARAGAKRVIGIEYSNMAIQSAAIIRDNNLDGVISIIHGKVEEVELPHGIDKVDIIISELMGYCLFCEATLNTLIFARDKWLKRDGALFPDRAALHICAIEARQLMDEKVNWWNNVYDFNMSRIRELVLAEPLIYGVNPNQVITSNAKLVDLDLYTARTEDLTWSTNFTLRIHRDDYVHALATFFTVEFSKCHQRTVLSTAPEAPLTHWRQTVFYLRDSLTVRRNDEIRGTFAIKPSERNNRSLEFRIGVDFENDIAGGQTLNELIG